MSGEGGKVDLWRRYGRWPFDATLMHGGAPRGTSPGVVQSSEVGAQWAQSLSGADDADIELCLSEAAASAVYSGLIRLVPLGGSIRDAEVIATPTRPEGAAVHQDAALPALRSICVFQVSRATGI